MNMQEWFAKLANDFAQTFITKDRWQLFAKGFTVTIRVAILALLMGIAIGVLVAIVRTKHDSRKKNAHGFGNVILNILNAICQVYLTIIRGTPMMVQLMIMYFVVFSSSRHEVAVATLAFGINSGAYVAEIVRSGIMSIDQGQTEAGRSLGLNFSQTMRLIIIPQAFKNVLPALVNEFIVLIKETSIIGYIGMMDLTKGAMLIQSRTYNAFWPLMAAAAIYLVIVGILTWGMNKLERRLRTSER